MDHARRLGHSLSRNSPLCARVRDLEPIGQGSLSARTYNALREALIVGRFRPGLRFIMNELAGELGTSITPVREACQRLVSERGLELRSGRFVAVPELTLERYLEVRTIRLVLEGLSAELACARISPTAVEELAELQASFETAERMGNREMAIRANRDFHFGVYRASGMEMLTAHIESLWISMGPILNIYYQVDTNYRGAEEHWRLIDALRERDGPKARTAIEQDIFRGGAVILAHLSRFNAS